MKKNALELEEALEKSKAEAKKIRVEKAAEEERVEKERR